MMKKKWISCFIASAGLLTSYSALAATAPTNYAQRAINSSFGAKTASHFKVNGFMSTGVSAVSSGDYVVQGVGKVTDNPSFAGNTLFGLQLQALLNPKIAVVSQLLVSGQNVNGNTPFNVKSDWIFLRYKPSQYLQIRGGRFRMPTFLYSSTVDVGYSYPWTAPPNEVYRVVPFTNINGIDFIFDTPLGKSGFDLKIQPFYGNNANKYDYVFPATAAAAVGDPASEQIKSTQTVTGDFTESHILGTVASISNQYLTVRGGYAQTYVSGHIPTFSGGFPPVTINKHIARFYTGAMKIDYNNALLIGEWAHRSTNNQIASLTGFYATAGYHIQRYHLLPLFTYAHLTTTNKAAVQAANAGIATLAEAQQSYTLGLDYYMGNNVVMKGSAGLIQPLDETLGLFDTLPKHKYTPLYSLTISAVF